MTTHPSVGTFTELQAFIDKRLASLESDLDDRETAQAFGVALMAKRATLLDIAFAIREAVEAEVTDAATVAHEESVEAQYREAYGLEPLAPYQAEGR